MNKPVSRRRRRSPKAELLKLAGIILACVVLANALTEFVKAVLALLRALGIL